MTDDSSIRSSRTSEERRRKLAKYSNEAKQSRALADLSDRDAKVRSVCRHLLRGKSRDEVADIEGLSVQEVADIEEMHFASIVPLSEQAMLMKQLGRLELLLDKAFEMTVDGFGNFNDVASTLAVIKEISELVGLKKTHLKAEVKVINERQVPIVVNYVNAVVNDLMGHVQPLLTKAGARQLEAHRGEWMVEATKSAADQLTLETSTLTM